MNAGRLRDLVTFQRRVLTTNALDQEVESWADDFQEWAEAQRVSETVCRFIIRYRTHTDGTQISAKTHKIIFDGAVWHITSAVHDGKRTQLTIDCDFSMMLEATHLQSTEREFIEGLPLLQPRND